MSDTADAGMDMVEDIVFDSDALQAQIQAVSAEVMRELRESQSPVEETYALNAAIEDLASIYADAATDDGEDEDLIDSAIVETLNQLIDSVGHNRRNYKQIYKDEKQRAADEQRDAPYIDDVLMAVERVVKNITTDESTDGQVTYELQFVDKPADIHGSLTISTSELNIAHGSLYDEDKFFNEFAGQTHGCYPIKGGRGSDDRDTNEWDNLVSQMLGRVELDTNIRLGSRTAAKDELLNKIEQATAYGTLTDALERSGVCLPDGLDSDEVQVPREFVVVAENKHDIGDNELQEELAARGLTSPDRPGDSVSWRTHVNRQRQHFWCLDLSCVDINEEQFVEEVEDSMDRMDDTVPSSDGGDGNDDGDRDEYGLIGSSGSDGGDGEDDNGEDDNGGDSA